MGPDGQVLAVLSPDLEPSLRGGVSLVSSHRLELPVSLPLGSASPFLTTASWEHLLPPASEGRFLQSVLLLPIAKRLSGNTFHWI